MIGTTLILALVVYALFRALPISDHGHRLVMTGTVLSTSLEDVTFENLTLEAEYDTAENNRLLEEHHTDIGYVFDLGWWNTLVLNGHRYAIAMRYDGDLAILLVEPDHRP